MDYATQIAEYQKQINDIDRRIKEHDRRSQELREERKYYMQNKIALRGALEIEEFKKQEAS